MTWNFDVHGNCTIDTPWSRSVDLSALNKTNGKERLSDVYLVKCFKQYVTRVLANKDEYS